MEKITYVSVHGLKAIKPWLFIPNMFLRFSHHYYKEMF